MDKAKILASVDHTILKPDTLWTEVKQICDDAISYRTASVCIPPSFVRQAKEYCKEAMKICTVIGFPNGYQTTAVKVFETSDARLNGADEIDMVISIGDLKSGQEQKIRTEISEIKQVCGAGVLKVIIETCLLSQQEKIKMCEIVTECGADFIKTSTGFNKMGATFEDIMLFKQHVGEHVKIKAAGGIRSWEDGERFLNLGADRLGTSRLVQLKKEEQA